MTEFRLVPLDDLTELRNFIRAMVPHDPAGPVLDQLTVLIDGPNVHPSPGVVRQIRPVDREMMDRYRSVQMRTGGDVIGEIHVGGETPLRTTDMSITPLRTSVSAEGGSSIRSGAAQVNSITSIAAELSDGAVVAAFPPHLLRDPNAPPITEDDYEWPMTETVTLNGVPQFSRPIGEPWKIEPISDTQLEGDDRPAFLGYEDYEEGIIGEPYRPRITWRRALETLAVLLVLAALAGVVYQAGAGWWAGR